MRIARNVKAAGCLHRHAVDNVIATKHAADNAAKERAWHTGAVLVLVCNRNRLACILDLNVTHDTAVTIRNQARKRARAIGVVDLDGRRRVCLLHSAQVANDNASEGITAVAKTLEGRRIKLKRISRVSVRVNRLDAVIRALEIAVHRIVVERGVGVGGFADLLFPLFACCIRLLVDVRHLV